MNLAVIEQAINDYRFRVQSHTQCEERMRDMPIGFAYEAKKEILRNTKILENAARDKLMQLIEELAK